MSLADLSGATGIDRGLLSKIEGGSRRPSVEQVRVLSEALDLNSELLGAEAGILPADLREALASRGAEFVAAGRQALADSPRVPRRPSSWATTEMARSVERPALTVDSPLEGDLEGRKSSTAYRAHSYHTKVPPETIEPFLKHFTRPGDLVLDPFCGSGMTGVAAIATGRHAILSDLAPAAIHIARNYVTPCDPEVLLEALEALERRLRPTMQWLYGLTWPERPRERTEYVTWSDRFACPECDGEWSYWDAARGPDGAIIGKKFPCPACGVAVRKTDCTWVGELPVEVNLTVEGERRRLVREPGEADLELLRRAEEKPVPYWVPEVDFGPWREMWRASHRAMGITGVRHFFSKRNLHALAALRHEILLTKDSRVRDALLFAFTGIVNRASRRYQWNAKRPTNVMTGTLYVSSLRYEWNVWSLFHRKAMDIVRYYRAFPEDGGRAEALCADATNLAHVPDSSIDFVYMDPPFGANIFYADVSLLWEAWLGDQTARATEIVVNKHLRAEDGGKSVEDYQVLMTRAFAEVSRVLKDGGHAILVFSNTDDAVWKAIQSSIADAGLRVAATGLLEKGQRSIKGVQADLGQQKVARVDLVLTLEKVEDSQAVQPTHQAPDLVAQVVGAFESESKSSLPTDVIYGRVLGSLIKADASVAGVDMAAVEAVCEEVCIPTDEGQWMLAPSPDFIPVSSPFGCLATEYVGDPRSVIADPERPVLEVDRPLSAAVPGSRNTALYNAHSYMTKVPPEAIQPFLEHYTRPGDTVLDMFAGSGMTGVAAAMNGRRAILRDISVVASHLAFNHTRPCDPGDLRSTWSRVYGALRPEFEAMYRVPLSGEDDGYGHYTLWSERYPCPECREEFTLWDAIDEKTGRVGASVPCPACSAELKRQRLRSVGAEPVLINFQAGSSKRRQTRTPTGADVEHIASFDRGAIADWYPHVRIGPDRDMFNVSALHLRGIAEVADFYTARNLAALARLLTAIQAVDDVRVRQALRFAFTNTAWHGTRMRRFNARGGQRPLTGTLYIPQISSEVNVLEVMHNKVKQLVRYYSTFPQSLEVPAPVVTLGSATEMSSIPNESVDYVFADPPFGSNIFYADCNLITEAWLGGITKVSNEAVVNRTIGPEQGGKSLDQYQGLLARAFREAHRVLKADGWMTLVFHNTDPGVWGAIQEAADSAGFEMVGAGSLDREQMSHKGYKGRGGKEKVAHFDVVMSLRKRPADSEVTPRPIAPADYVSRLVSDLRKRRKGRAGAQWVHSQVLRHLVEEGYDLGSVGFADVSRLVTESIDVSDAE